jgi:hypothetical protein
MAAAGVIFIMAIIKNKAIIFILFFRFNQFLHLFIIVNTFLVEIIIHLDMH